MKISHLSGQALGIINLQRGPAKPQVFTPTPVDHCGEEQPLSTELFSRDKRRWRESRSDRPGVTSTARAAAAACPAPVPHCLRMPEAVHGPAGQSLPQPAQTAGLMDNRCQAAAQRRNWVGCRVLGITAKHTCTPGCQRASYTTPLNSGCCKRGE